MAGRDQDFQRELREREAAAKNNAAEQSVRQQQMANALANRTQTVITLKGVNVNLLRLVDEEENFHGVTLLFQDPAFNTIYSYQMDADSAAGFYEDFGTMLSGDLGNVVPEDPDGQQVLST